MIKAYSALDRVDEALALWNEMTTARSVEPTVFSVGCIVHALVMGDRLDEAVQLVEEWKDRVNLNSVVYSTLIKGHVKRADSAGALKVLDQMAARSVTPTIVTLNSLIDACCRSGDMKHVWKLYEDMPAKYSIKQDQITYSTMIKGFLTRHQLKGTHLRTANPFSRQP